ncbi:MAG: hypothetical protein GX667_00560, partial [Xanthomonadaceae bacterium]|nr:hypothetical protein [Xanthomonadaceae bacterium]
HTVGVFEFEENIHAFIRSIPFVEIETYEIDDVTFTDYSIPYQSLPASYLVRYCGADFLLSHTMFTDHENAIFLVGSRCIFGMRWGAMRQMSPISSKE